MNKKFKLVILLTLIFVLAVGSLTVYADDEPTNLIKESGNKTKEFKELEENVDTINASMIALIRKIGNGVGLIALLLLGISYMLAKDNSQKMMQLKDRTKNIVIGILIFFAAWNIFWMLYKIANSVSLGE